MGANGFQNLRRHVPSLNSRWGWLCPLLALAAVFALASLFFLAADRYFAEWMPDGEIVILALGLLILSRFFSQRARYEQSYGDRAYSLAFARFFIPGLGIVVASIAHLAYITGPEIPSLWWTSWLKGLGYLLVTGGILLCLRAVEAAGFDSLLMLYVYYPEEGRQRNSGIYGTVRHPIYAAAQDFGFGLALIHLNWYALLVAVLLPLFYAGWIRLVEEPELLKRFPDYEQYRRRVPAFAPAIADFGRFWRCMLTGK